MNTWAWLKGVLAYIVAAAVGWLYIGYQKNGNRIDSLADRISQLEIGNEISKVMIKNICDDVAEIKLGVSQLVNSKRNK